MTGVIGLLTGDQPGARYLEEILSHAGLPWCALTGADLARERGARVVVLVGAPALDAEARERLRRLVERGGAVIAVGGTRGLGDLLGALSTWASQNDVGGCAILST